MTTPSQRRITIRHAEPADFQAVHRIMSGERAVSGTLQLPYPSLELWRKRLAEPRDDLITLVACAESEPGPDPGRGSEVVGNLGLHTNPNRPRRRHVASLGMAVRDDWQGRGVGSALLAAAVDLADNWLNLVRLELEVFTDNEAAVRLYRRAGFVREGTLRKFAFRDGEYVDAYLMARLQPEREQPSPP